MPKYKNTRAGNKKRNIDLQKKLNEQKSIEDNDVMFNFFPTTNIDKNREWAKKVNIKFFRYYKQNLICGKIGETKADVLYDKIKKGKVKSKNFLTMNLGNDCYIIRKSFFDQFNKDFIGLLGFCDDQNTEEKMKECLDDVKAIILKLIYNPPNFEGGHWNWNIGSFGSIWIDTPKYRLAFYNRDKEGVSTKDYNIKDFYPKFCMMRQ